MLIGEVRDVLKKYKEEDLRLIIAEMYKAMPKKLKEEKNVDEMLKDIQGFTKQSKAEKKVERPEMGVLKPEILRFIQYAYNQFYFAPNSFVHKKDRPKWRFLVKDYIAALQSFPFDGEDGAEATELMEKLFQMLSYGSGYYIFNTDNPFRSIGISQHNLLDTILARKFHKGFSTENIRSAIIFVTDSQLDSGMFDSAIMERLRDKFVTADSKLMAIEQGNLLRMELSLRFSKQAKNASPSSMEQYRKNEAISILVDMIFWLNIELGEYDDAIRYYKTNNSEGNQELALNTLLSRLYRCGLKDRWIREYEDAVRKKVKPREPLQRMYAFIKEHDELPNEEEMKELNKR
jgi:hypothetical protein